ncbi:hypothetical protein PLESTB_001650700 [Pleodorina starrii]|uniref:Peptidase M28 domain-containing protein n=1 Tax=Pleodorina starrii TaxID=330485 RepID=A0A9W6BYL3_9CHLO|nr:hypothetical protein PLESTM_000870600 [Pleodorina starrii]GLC60638.1 hypothetical protein PLESTB_001650700 [Pleodorina starrii]GLC68895.1 hypothetical protein PLESTF_000755300 [Pleodorina starrii]
MVENSSAAGASAAASKSVRKSTDDERAEEPIVPWANARLLALGLIAYYAIMLPLMELRLHWTPPVRPASAPPDLFSEQRAMTHVEALAGQLPDRQISMPQLQKAHEYIVRQGQMLAELAAARGGDVEVKVHRETVSGSVAMDFGGVPFTNAYRGLTNIVVTLTPAAAVGRPGLLIAAHHDSAVASPGASDDVSMVAVVLEAARALLSRPTSALPGVPLVLLFDGGEESICQAGHGFFNSSPHARGLGAFINLEAMGAGGLPILFQHTGGWTVEAWARGARNAHGARIAQDIFDTGIIPGDTDYRMFSARHFGSLPGLDIAFIRDSAAYHSHLDNVGRLRRGAMQDMGDALLGGLMSMAAALAADTEGQLRSAKALRDRSVYFDLIGCGMVTYPDSLAALLHTAPLALLLMMPLASVAAGHTAAGVMCRMLAAAGRAVGALLGAVVAPAVLGVARVAVSGVAMSWYSRHWLAYATFLPLSVAVAVRPWLGLRAEAMKRRPGQQGHYVACQVYGVGLVLSALAAGLCCCGVQGFSQVLAMGGLLAFVVGSLLDNGAPTLTSSVAAGVFAVVTVPLVVMTAILGTFLDVMMERMALTGHHSIFLADGVIGLLTGSAVLGYSCSCLLPLAGYALGGLLDRYQDDETASKRSGSSSSSSSSSRSSGKGGGRSAKGGGGGGGGGNGSAAAASRLVLAVLVAASAAASGWSSLERVPYSRDSPRRITITHLHETGSWVPEDDAFPASAARAVAAAVAAAELHPAAAATPAEVQEPPPSPEAERRDLAAQLRPPPPSVPAKLVLGIVDSNPWAQLFPEPAAALAAFSPVVRQGSAVRYDGLAHEYAWLHPLDRLLGKMVMEAEPCTAPLVAVPPYVRKVGEERRGGGGQSDTDGGGRRRTNGTTTRVVHLRVFSEAHCWGMLNFTSAAPLRAWSLPSAPVSAAMRPPPPPSSSSSYDSQRRQPYYYYHMVRFSHEAESPFWDLWVELQGWEGVNGAGAEGTREEGRQSVPRVSAGETDPRVSAGETDPWVIVELSATYLPLTAELRAVQDALPDWVAPTWIGTTYHSSYKF